MSLSVYIYIHTDACIVLASKISIANHRRGARPHCLLRRLTYHVPAQLAISIAVVCPSGP